MMVEKERQGVLVSVIGAGNYKEVEYILAGRGSSRSSFATWALKELLQDEETFDEVLIFGVKGAAWHLVDSHLPEARKVYLPEVKTQQEVDEGFLLIEKTLREFQSPSLTLDLTHGYRHHVMLILLTTFYLSMLEHLSLEGIYYAMLPYREEQAQFLDLMPFFSLLKTVVRVKTFQETMHATGISDLREELQRVRNAFGRRKEVDRASAVGKVEKVLKALEDLDLFLSINNTPQIAIRAHSALERIKESRGDIEGIYPYLLPFLEAMEEEVSKLETGASTALWKMQLDYAEHCLSLGRYTSAAINLREGLVSWACWRWSGCKDRRCEDGANCISNGREFRERLTPVLDGVGSRKMVFPEEVFSRCAELYNEISDLRNKICHGYLGHEEAIGRDRLKGRLGELIKRTKALFEEASR